MSSEYQKWLARNEKPEEKRKLTPAEKRRNWWDYHKWHVVIAVGLMLCMAWTIWSTVQSDRTRADYEIAYIASRRLPDETVEALERALAEYGVDLTGDGRVRVQVNQYTSADDYTGGMKLFADLVAGNNCIFLTDDPELVQERYGVLAYSDGTYPAEGETLTKPLWYAWKECAVLANLDLGTYTDQYSTEKEVLGNNQDLFTGLYIGRGGISKDDNEERSTEYSGFWNQLTNNGVKAGA